MAASIVIIVIVNTVYKNIFIGILLYTHTYNNTVYVVLKHSSIVSIYWYFTSL